MVRITFRSAGGPKRRRSVPSWSSGAPLPKGEALGSSHARRMAEAADLVMLHSPRSESAEVFRRLKNLLVNEYESMRVIVVTSAGPDDGKSVVAANLALAFATGDKGETLLIDADLRRPTLGRRLDPPPGCGLSDLVSGRCTLDEAVVVLDNAPLRVLAAGAPVSDPLGMLSSQAARDLVSQLRARFQRIVIDTPPILLFTDADGVGAVGDGFLMVTRARHTLKVEYTQALSMISSAPLIGTVLNDARPNLADRQRFRSRYHEYYDDGDGA